MEDRQKDSLRKNFSKDNMTYRYQQAIKFFLDGADKGMVDVQEYKTFKEITLKRDVNALGHGYFGMAFTFEEYWDIMQALVGFDLMVQGAISGQIKAKKNGEDKED